jgi:hypothetical protein
MMKSSSNVICGGLTDMFTINILAKVESKYYMTVSVSDPRSYILHVLLLTQILNHDLFSHREGELISVYDDDAVLQPPGPNKSVKRKGSGNYSKKKKLKSKGTGDENCDCINISNDNYDAYLSDLHYLRTIELRKLGTPLLTEELLRSLG